MRTSILAAAVAIGLSPAAASAVTIDPTGIQPGSTNDVSNAPFFFDSAFADSDTAGTFDFIFTNNTLGAAAVTVSEGTILQQTLEFVGGVTVSWLQGGDSFSVGTGENGLFSISSLIPVGDSDTLRIAFGEPTNGGSGRADIDFSVAVSAVPLPASLALLLGGIGGLGFLGFGRRKPAAT